MPTKVRRLTRIKLRDLEVQKKAGVYLLKTPHLNHCCKCREFRVAIAAFPTGNSIQTNFKWLCPKCALDLGIQPTQELLKKLPTMNTLRGRECRCTFQN
ncbi:hypothetical protein [Acaryochloris marina]|uniref:hypothetical protein n=1 Tax=Acaryochloris marina TaxID=155978 RepID=UPI0011D07986|nr:hypothetical protein [Acaryochloris marina]